MVVTNVGRSGTALMLTGSYTFPGWLGIGSGSGAVGVTNTALIAETDRNLDTSTDVSNLYKVVWQFDFSSIEMSGTFLKELGLFNISSGGKLWHREGFSQVEFDGTNELQVELTWEVV